MPNYGEGYSMDVPVTAAGPGFGELPNPTIISDNSLHFFATLPGVNGVYPRDYLQNCCMIQFDKLEGYGSIVGVNPTMLRDFGLNVENGSLDLTKVQS
jgi:hypothetical protein